MGQIGLWMRYLERDMPKYEAKADKLLFEPLGMHETLTRDQKTMAVLGGAVAAILVPLLFCCCLCCGGKKKAAANRKAAQ